MIAKVTHYSLYGKRHANGAAIITYGKFNTHEFLLPT